MLQDAQIGKILVEHNYVSQEDMDRALVESKKRNISVEKYLVKEDLVTNDLLGQALAEFYGVQYADLNSHQPVKEQVLQIPEVTARKHRIVLYRQTDKGVVVTTDDPAQNGLKAALKKMFPKGTVTITYSLPQDIEVAFINYKKELKTRFSQIIKTQSRVAPEIIEAIFDDAYSFHASDIHFEPQDDDVAVRFRIDGVLQEAGRIPKDYYQNVVNRIKVQSGLRIDEHFTPQDGSMRHKKGGVALDLRTSIIPTVTGEKIVLRILAAYVEGLELSTLGLTAENKKILEEAAKKPFGMILVVGPTGSGKTTTLYGVLKIINTPDVNITTIEDPVEYKVTGINQIQTNNLTQLTFARGLRSIVRQDPDIILVGEIRDEETADISVNAALTGHLLLSTFHANNAPTAIPRLLDMSIEPFLLASTLEVVMAQRLVRKICDTCRYSVSVNTKDIIEKMPSVAKYFSEKQVTLYAGKGCPVCSGTGYKGRTGVFEIIQVDNELQELILKNPSTQEIADLARSKGFKTMFEDGLIKVREGATTLDELLRVASPE